MAAIKAIDNTEKTLFILLYSIRWQRYLFIPDLANQMRMRVKGKIINGYILFAHPSGGFNKACICHGIIEGLMYKFGAV
jgi:hypothetical protein